MKKKLLLSLFIFSLLSTSSFATPKLTSKEKQKIQKYWPLFKDAGERYNIEPQILLAISLHESSLRPEAINKANRNKTIDVGMMQVNSWWFPTLRKYTKDMNSLYEPKFNIAVGAWIFAKCAKRYGVSWKAIDCYNKGENRAHNTSTYVRKVRKKYSLVKEHMNLK